MDSKRKILGSTQNTLDRARYTLDRAKHTLERRECFFCAPFANGISPGLTDTLA